MAKPTSSENNAPIEKANHREAEELAYLKCDKSNLARAYIELTSELARYKEENERLLKGIVKIQDECNRGCRVSHIAVVCECVLGRGFDHDKYRSPQAGKEPEGRR